MVNLNVIIKNIYAINIFREHFCWGALIMEIAWKMLEIYCEKVNLPLYYQQARIIVLYSSGQFNKWQLNI